MIEKSILSSFTGKNVVVTGGTGLIGRQIVDILCDAGAKVAIVSLDKIQVNKKAKHIFGDLTEFSFCKEVTKDIDFVFHVAGIKGSIEVTKSKPASFFVPLLMFNTNVLEACRINKVKKVVYTSSIGAYSSAEVFKESGNRDGEPMDMFPGWAKRMAEMQVKAYKVQYGLDNFSIVRPCNV
ncbi:MAG: NAD(P)-dependent oxidoreductase, partial [Syntrophales bacterium]